VNIIRHLYYLPVFYVSFILIRILTFVLVCCRFKKLVSLLRRKGKKKKLLYLEAFFPENAGYYYRSFKWTELFSPILESRIFHLLEKERFIRLLKHNPTDFQIACLFQRLVQCFCSVSYDAVIVRRELLLYNDYGNLFMEKLLLSLHPNVILDFDDDISAAKKEPRPISLFGKLMLENPDKFKRSLQLYERFIPGSGYLRQMVLDCNRKAKDEEIQVIPTCVDYVRHSPKSYAVKKEDICFGWIGTPGNLIYLDMLIAPLNRIAEERKISLRIISGAPYQHPEARFEIDNLAWSLEHETTLLSDIDIGLMPLFDTEVERGKCGFKLIQYMGLGIVSIASAITVNKEIIDDERNGFLVHGSEQWTAVLQKALSQEKRFEEIGKAAREKILKSYSFEAHKEKYLNFILGGQGH
jgi:glycosyltransferase involved in cell wall biosynthesis